MTFAFAYIHTANDNEPVLLTDEQHAALILPGCNALAILAEDIVGLKLTSADITKIEVETGEDADDRGLPDKDEPGTHIVYPTAI